MYTTYAGCIKEDFTIIIDGQRITCDPEASILEAARDAGIEIPTLCYLKGLTPTGSCGACAVELMETAPGLRNVDAVLTTREAAKLFRMRGIDLRNIKGASFDQFMGTGTGAARIFGTTGGVMEAALRTVTVLLTDGELNQIEHHAVRGYRGVKEATVKIGDKTVNVAIVNGIGNVRPVLDDIRSGKSKYHFIEVMACPGAR